MPPIIRRFIPAFTAIGLFFFGNLSDLIAQGTPPPNPVMERELARAEAYLISFKNDSALVIADKLLKELKAEDQVDTPFGIRAQLAEALAIEQDQRGKLAMKKLLILARKSQQKGLWKVHVRASLALALLNEKVGSKESSREQLDLARADIELHNLDALYPYFAIRRSSWERLYGDPKEALFFAREALRTAPAHGLLLEEAISHMLLNLLLPPSALNERMRHCQSASRLYRQLGDYTGYGSMLEAIARIQAQRKNFRLALAYNDSSLVAANLAIAEGNDKHESIGTYYLFRGNIYQQMGLLDSALVNMQKGYSMELALKERAVTEEVIEIDARYQNKYKQQQIEEQRLALRLKNDQLLFSSVIVLLVLSLAVALFVGYRKQHRAKRKLIEQNALVRDQATQLKSLDAAKSHFFANVSHELRTPLSLIVGPLTTLLKENQWSEKQTVLLNAASRSARQLEAMVKDILDLRKLEMGKMPLHEELTELATFFRLHLEQFESLAQWRQIYFSHEIKILPALVAELDREKCRQVLYNLLSNAFKFTPALGRVEVAVWMQGDQLAFRVTDTGSGIHPDDLPQVFDRFFRSNRKSRPSVDGTGIGLAICREYTQLMQGDIHAESKPGEGSVFQASWPIALCENNHEVVSIAVTEIVQPYEGTVPMPESVAAHQPTILVVEDNPGLREYLHLILSEHYNVLLAENGAVALQKLAAGNLQVDLVMSDLTMPVMDGYELLENLKSGDATRHIPVIMLTARAELADRLHALRIGVDDYLTKPFEEEELLVRIANLLKNQSVRKQEALLESQEGDAPPQFSETDQAWLKNFERFVGDNLSSDTLTIPALSENFAMSESSLLRQLKRLTGLSPVQYLQQIRLNEARLLLERGTHDSVTSVAYQVGYKDARSFSRSFKKRFGKLPGDFA